MKKKTKGVDFIATVGVRGCQIERGRGGRDGAWGEMDLNMKRGIRGCLIGVNAS